MRRRVLQAGFLAILGTTGGACGSSGPVLPVEPSATATAAAPAPPPSPPLPPGTLAIESFSLVEFRYSWESEWSYAPLVRVTCPVGTGGVAITRVELAIPGLPALGPLCAGGLRVEGGQGVDLFGEVYGDYQVTFDAAGARAADGEATATITFEDGTGLTGTVVARSAVVPGGLPTTYSGGTAAPTWWHHCR